VKRGVSVTNQDERRSKDEAVNGNGGTQRSLQNSTTTDTHIFFNFNHFLLGIINIIYFYSFSIVLLLLILQICDFSSLLFAGNFSFSDKHFGTHIIWICIGIQFRWIIMICPQMVFNIEKLINTICRNQKNNKYYL
jgi:hypothetical protein